MIFNKCFYYNWFASIQTSILIVRVAINLSIAPFRIDRSRASHEILHIKFGKALGDKRW